MSDKILLQNIGDNFETFLLDQNEFADITIVTEVEATSNEVKEAFKSFDNYEVIISKDFENPFAPIPENRYEYIFKNNTKDPFLQSKIFELEHAPEFGASWKSVYVWILFDWVLISKENTGIS